MRGGLIDDMKKNGFKPVAINAHLTNDQIARRFKVNPGSSPNANSNRPIFLATANRGISNGKSKVFFKVNSPGASEFKIHFDRAAPKDDLTKPGPNSEFEFEFSNPGARVMTVTATFPDGAKSTVDQPFIVPAAVATNVSQGGPGSLNLDGQGSEAGQTEESVGSMPYDVESFNSCISIEKMKAGRTFDLFSGSGKLSAKETKNDVKKTKVELIRGPFTAAASTWQVTYKQKVNDYLTDEYDIAFSTETGCIAGGVRTRRNTREKSVEEAFIKGLFVDCKNKVWRGEIITPSVQTDAQVAALAGSSAQGDNTNDSDSKVEWFTFHADESDDQESLNAGPGQSNAIACSEQH